MCVLETLPTNMLDLFYRFGQCPVLCICYVLLLNQLIWYKPNCVKLGLHLFYV